ncbi:MAG TPA: hypothetical protein ENJ95_00390 [Bacteroidetes bacterium]|nr:hypothetical protein [Bacteroidota bacterium]
MQTATISELKKELAKLDPSRLTALCLRLAKYKKDNKELLTYLLFEAENEAAYANSVKSEIDEQMKGVKTHSVYLAKKGLRKILRLLDKRIRYSGNKETEAELRIYFCRKIKMANIPVRRSRVLTNLYDGQVKKIRAAISKLHEDLQYDYGVELEGVIYHHSQKEG